MPSIEVQNIFKYVFIVCSSKLEIQITCRDVGKITPTKAPRTDRKTYINTTLLTHARKHKQKKFSHSLCSSNKINL